MIFWDAAAPTPKKSIQDHLERDKEGGGRFAAWKKTVTFRFPPAETPHSMPEAKGAGLVHGENWAAKCEPVGKSQLQVAACSPRKRKECSPLKKGTI